MFFLIELIYVFRKKCSFNLSKNTPTVIKKHEMKMNTFQLVIQIVFINSVNCNYFNQFTSAHLAGFDMKSFIFTNTAPPGGSAELFNINGGMLDFEDFFSLLVLSLL